MGADSDQRNWNGPDVVEKKPALATQDDLEAAVRKAIEDKNKPVGLASKWYGIGDQQVAQQLGANIDLANQQSNMGLNQGLGSLAQRGGLNQGTRERLAMQSALGQVNAGAQLAQQANANKLDIAQKGIMGIELPIMQGNDAMKAQKQAYNAANEKGGLAGAARGAAMGSAILPGWGTAIGGVAGGLGII